MTEENSKPALTIGLPAALVYDNHKGFDSLSALQDLASDWVTRAFGPEELHSPSRRIRRVLEEILELAQSADVPSDVIHGLVEHVYSRPVGDLGSEYGASLFTLLSFATAARLDPAYCMKQCLIYAYGKLPEIQERNNLKPKDEILSGEFSQTAKDLAAAKLARLGFDYDDIAHDWVKTRGPGQ